MRVGTGRQNIIILFWKYQFHFWEYIKGNQTFILDSHRPFICSVAASRCASHPAPKTPTALLYTTSFSYDTLRLGHATW
jgi:hypothetical protein